MAADEIRRVGVKRAEGSFSRSICSSAVRVVVALDLMRGIVYERNALSANCRIGRIALGRVRTPHAPIPRDRPCRINREGMMANIISPLKYRRFLGARAEMKRWLLLGVAAALPFAWSSEPCQAQLTGSWATGFAATGCGACTGAATGGVGGAAMGMDMLGLGITLFGAIQSMDQQQKGAASGGSAAGSGATAPIGIFPSDFTNQQRSVLFSGMRPIGMGSYLATAPDSPVATSSIADVVNEIRPLNASRATMTGGAGTSVVSAPIAAQKTALLVGMRPLNGRASQPHTAADQLCQAAGRKSGCIRTFHAHGMRPVAASAGTSGQHAVAANAPATAPVDAARGTSTVGAVAASAENPPGASASANASDESTSMNARVPFDTAANSVGSSTGCNSVSSTSFFGQGSGTNCVSSQSPALPPSIAAASPDKFSNGSLKVAQARIATEVKTVQRDACARLSQLETQLAGYQHALRNLQATANNAATERKEWEDRLNETGDDAFHQLPGALIVLLDVDVDNHVEDLNKEIQRALDSRINATDSNIRQQYDIALRALEDQKKKFLFDQDKIMKDLDWSETGVVEVPDLMADNDKWDKYWSGANQVLGILLGFSKKYSGYGQAQGIANLLYDASYDLYSEGTSLQHLAELNRGTDEYFRAVTELQGKIKDTVGKIKRARDDVHSMQQSSGACATAA